MSTYDKVIFLDMDGVLVTLPSLKSYKYRYQDLLKDPDKYEDQKVCGCFDHLMIDPVLMESLNKILERTRAKIVWSTAWRVGSSPESASELLKAAGCIQGVVDFTPLQPDWDLPDTREGEIISWLRMNDVSNILILEDEPINLLRDYTIATDLKTGLLPQFISKAVHILDLPFEFEKIQDVAV
jgi:hypothetical protein